MTVKAREDVQRIHLSGPSEALERLRMAFRYHPKGYNFSPRYEEWRLSGGKQGWDGYLYPLQVMARTRAVIARGYRDRLTAVCVSNGIELEAQFIESPFSALTIADVNPHVIRTPFALDEYQRQGIVAWLLNVIGINKVTVSGGKCLGLGTPVIMADGRLKKVEDVEVGDLLLGPDSRPRRVLALGRGRARMYRVEQANGCAYTCNGDHILALQRRVPSGGFYNGRRRYQLRNLTLTVGAFMALPAWLRKEHFGYKVGVELPAQDVPVEPYLLGLWLGDGSRHKPEITTGDVEVKNYVIEAASRIGLNVRAEKGTGCEQLYLTTGKKTPRNEFNRKLRALGLPKGAAKHIPDVYKRNSRETRLALLAGLIDTDGWVKRAGQIEITSVYRELAYDIVWLARSLGFSASVRPKRTTCQTGAVGIAYRVRITGDLRSVPTRIARKRCGACIKGGLRTRISVTPLDVDDYYGFELDGDGLFLLGDFTVTHNTAMFCAVFKLLREHFPDVRAAYITVAERLVRQVAREAHNFLPEMDIGQFGGGKHDHDAKDMVVCTLAMLNRNLADLTAVGWFRSIDVVLFDEVQHAASPSASRVMARIPAMWRFAASDSVKADDPRAHDLITGLFGSVLTTVTAAPHIVTGRIAMPHIYAQSISLDWRMFRDTPYRAEVGTTAWCLIDGVWRQGVYRGQVQAKDDKGRLLVQRRSVLARDKHGNVIHGKDGRLAKDSVLVSVTESGMHLIEFDGTVYEIESRWVLLDRVYDTALVNCAARNELIAKWAGYYSGKGRRTLVVATRTLHIYIIEALLRERLENPDLVRILFGWASSSERDAAFDWLRSTPGAVLVTPLVKEGVSIPEIEAGVVADNVSDPELANQIIGRFIRRKPNSDGNYAEITWFGDQHHARLRSNASLVLRTFAALDYLVYSGGAAPDIDELIGGAVSPADASVQQFELALGPSTETRSRPGRSRKPRA